MNIVNRMFIYFLYLTGVVDLINGFVISEIGRLPVSIGQIYRFMFLIIIFWIIISNKIKFIKSLFFIIVFYFTSMTLITTFQHGNVTVLTNDFINLSKLFLNLGIFVAGKSLLDRGEINSYIIKKIIKFNMYCITLSLLFCKLFNLGEYAYINDVGFKGYFYSNNELSIVLSLMFIYFWENIYKSLINIRKLKLKDIIDLFLITISLILIGSKTSYIIIIITIFISIVRAFKNLKISTILKVTSIFLIILIALEGILHIYSNEINKIIEKQLFYFNNRDIVSFILSDRNVMWNQIKYNIMSNSNIFNKLFGFRRIIINNTTFINIEMDGNVLYLNYGIIGFLLIIVMYMHVYIKSQKRFILIYPFIIYIMFSLLAGHVMFSAFSGTFLSLHCIRMLESNIYKRGD